MSRREVCGASWGLALALLLVLSLGALPAVAGPVSGGPWSLWAQLRSWLGWEGPVFSLAAEAPRRLNKEGVDIDPHGQPHAAAPGEQVRPEPNKEGSMIDPHGQPHAVAPGDLSPTSLGSPSG